jgi:hypothetical protein
MTTDEQVGRDDWPMRPWIIGVLGAVAGLLIHLLTDASPVGDGAVAMAAFVAASAILVAFTLERVRWRWAIVFSVGTGAVVALVTYWYGSPDSWSPGEEWRMWCVVLAVAIAAPLFQAARDAGAARFSYPAVHGHAWTNIVIWGASMLFVGVVFALAFLLSALFELIGIKLLSSLLDDEWFAWMLGGGAFGAAIAMARERDRVVGLMQRMFVSVLAVLAPVLGAGLALFLLSLPFTGLAPLWDATKSTTPILLTCVIGALILANAVIGNSAAEESRVAPLRYGALALALSMLPLAVIAAVSTGARIDQYGLTPERLWALVFVAIACAFGLAYLWAILRHRLAWAEAVRPANLTLGFALCGIALLLATPLVGFNALSARDQLARIEKGQVRPDKIDWAALAFDFGAPGKAAVRTLARSENPAIRRAATRALATDNRWELAELAGQQRRIAQARTAVPVVPDPVPLPAGLLDSFRAQLPDDDPVARIHYRPGDRSAVLVSYPCEACQPVVTVSRAMPGGGWRVDDRSAPYDQAAQARYKAMGAAVKAGRVDVRPVERRQVFIDGQPIGDAFE